MTTRVAIPGATAYHLPAPGAKPVALAEGDLALIVLPAAPPRKDETLTLTVGESTFVLSRNAPVQRTNSKDEHPSLVFSPAPLSDGRLIGQVRIDFRDSRNADEWERTEIAYKALEFELKRLGMWEDKVLFVDDEYETGGVDTTPKVGWGESIANNFAWATGKLLGKKEKEPVLPTSLPVAKEGEVYTTLGPSPSGTPAPRDTPFVPAHGPQAHGQAPTGDFKALASHSWNQATIAAQGIGAAAVAVGSAVGHQVRDAVDNIQHPAPPVPDKDGPPTPDKEGVEQVTEGVAKVDLAKDEAKEVKPVEVEVSPVESSVEVKTTEETSAAKPEVPVEVTSAQVTPAAPAEIKAIDDKLAKKAEEDTASETPKVETEPEAESATPTEADDDENDATATTDSAPKSKNKKKKGKKGKN